MIQLVLLIIKGVLRDQQARRKWMFWVMLAALGILFAGTVLLSDAWARQHPWLYLSYWLLCAWLTITAMLLALLDMLILRATHRIQRRKIEEQILKNSAEELRK